MNIHPTRDELSRQLYAWLGLGPYVDPSLARDFGTLLDPKYRAARAIDLFVMLNDVEPAASALFARVRSGDRVPAAIRDFHGMLGRIASLLNDVTFGAAFPRSIRHPGHAAFNDLSRLVADETNRAINRLHNSMLAACGTTHSVRSSLPPPSGLRMVPVAPPLAPSAPLVLLPAQPPLPAPGLSS